MNPNNYMVEIKSTQQFNQMQKDSNIPLEMRSNIDVDDPKEIFKCP